MSNFMKNQTAETFRIEITTIPTETQTSDLPSTVTGQGEAGLTEESFQIRITTSVDPEAACSPRPLNSDSQER